MLFQVPLKSSCAKVIFDKLLNHFIYLNLAVTKYNGIFRLVVGKYRFKRLSACVREHVVAQLGDSGFTVLRLNFTGYRVVQVLLGYTLNLFRKGCRKQ